MLNQLIFSISFLVIEFFKAEICRIGFAPSEKQDL